MTQVIRVYSASTSLMILIMLNKMQSLRLIPYNTHTNITCRPFYNWYSVFTVYSRQRSLCMIILYDPYVWSLCMIIMYDHYVWPLCMIILYDHYVWSLCMIIMHEHYVWSFDINNEYAHNLSNNKSNGNRESNLCSALNNCTIKSKLLGVGQF